VCFIAATLGVEMLVKFPGDQNFMIYGSHSKFFEPSLKNQEHRGRKNYYNDEKRIDLAYIQCMCTVSFLSVHFSQIFGRPHLFNLFEQKSSLHKRFHGYIYLHCCFPHRAIRMPKGDKSGYSY